MDVLEIARWQFGITTVYHFLFVPITIGLSAHHRRHGDRLGADREAGVPPPHEVLRHGSSSSTSRSAW